jgi:hypothetical protein
MSAVAVAIGALAVAVMFAASRPVVAGPVCNKVDLRTPCIGSNDIRANIALGGATGDARLRLRNGDGANAVDLRASNGSLANLFSNGENESNGLVKAWAQIFSDGTVFACWRCNRDPNETRRLATGAYEVDFTPLATDITGRPRSATLDSNTENQVMAGAIILGDRSADSSSVLVTTRLDGSASDLPFVLIIY